MTLRPYQQEASDAAKAWIKSCVEPCVIGAATGAGKSHIIADLAGWLHDISGGKRVLCLAPQKELTKQNYAKFRATGAKASIFAASAGIKSTANPVVFGMPATVKNNISRFTRDGKNGYCAVIIDEAHTIAPTILSIIDAMRDANPNLRVIGLTATPYKLGHGYIFRQWPDGRINGDETARNPYFARMVYNIEAPALIKMGYLTPPVIGAINQSDAYDTSGLIMLPNGKFDAQTVDAAFVGHGRRTAAIVADIVAHSRNRRGVVIFAATIRHAEEVLASLPPEMSAMVHGETPNRAKILDAFDRQEIKYLVNVAVLTTGWDCPHADVVAIMRRTESVGLLQQIIGRGLRLFDGKDDCLILDYAGNLDTHCPDGDLFAPVVKAGKAKGDGVIADVVCPDCGGVNEFRLNPDYDGFKMDVNGYCVDAFGERIITEYGPLSAHYGRRCMGDIDIGRGKRARCGYRWAGKDCPQCEEKNDIAARYCYACKAEIVDPNEKLIGDYRAMKRDPTQPQTDIVRMFETSERVSQKGNKTLRVDWVTSGRQFSVWLLPDSTYPKQKADYDRFMDATNNGTDAPETVSYVKDAGNQFYRILAYNLPADESPEEQAERLRMGRTDFKKLMQESKRAA